MKSYATKIFFILLVVLFQNNLSAQSASEGNYYSPEAGYYMFGINGGWAYQSSDIRNDFSGYGLGLTLGKNLFYRQGAPLSLDLRGRLLYTKSLGIDGERSFDIQNNIVLSGIDNLDYTNFPTELDVENGFVFHNHRTDIGELSLEAVLRLNRLREQTGFIVGLYGGIGLDYYLTRIDQLKNGEHYYTEYANLDPSLSKSQTVERLKNGILDGTFETNADGFSNGPRLDWMPSLGLELGYQITPNFAFLLGHRATFARNNILDGQEWADANNDLYHYTSLGLEWNISPKEKKQRKPEIDVRVPEFNPHVQNSRYANVRANIRYINSAADVQFYVNNRKEPFEYSNGRFSTNFTLEPGRNEIVISASNAIGTARKLLVINWEQGSVISIPNDNNPPPPPNTGNPPTVRFDNPARDNTTTTNANYSVIARISGVQSRSNIEFSINGITQNFNYNSSSDELTANVSLVQGQNRIVIRARNQYGNDQEQRYITLERRGEVPEVRITRPGNNTRTESANINLEARINGIEDSREITLLLNGNRVNFFNFSGNTLRETLTLREGNNTIVVQAQNRYGRDEDQVNVRYSKPVIETKKPPRVNITDPVNNSTAQQQKVNLRAKIENVRSRNNIRLTVNGGSVNNFTYNSLSGLLTAQVNLVDGNNTISVRATNEDGQDQQSVNVRYVAQALPKVTITNPNNSPHTSNTRTLTAKARITNVPNKSGVQITLNGQRVNNFNYSSSGQVSVLISLKEGNNTLRIKGINNSGNDEDSVNIRYSPAKNPPIVKIITPKNEAKLTSSKVRFSADVKNASKRQVSVFIDGKSFSNFTMTGTKVSGLANVQSGRHTLIVKAVNGDGSDDQTVVFYYNRPIAKPTVKITQPSKSGMTVKQERTTLKASVTGVKSKAEISVKLNGRSVNFNFDTRTKTINALLTLRSGDNNVIVTATNTGGSASDKRLIKYFKTSDIPTSKLKPKVTITSVSAPATNPFDPDRARSTIIAIIDNISSKSEITFTYKGEVRTDFTFNKLEKRFQITVDLTRGENPFTIKASNRAGSDTEERVISF